MEVFALIGLSGTGKSHRAVLVAHQCGADLILDDGLLIKDSKIVAGRSAKAASTRIGAVRTAIFSDPQHREEVRRELAQMKPRRLLVLGTSKAMIQRIVRALDLPLPTRYISIDEIATPEEIQQALRTRREQGKHVIPAPTLEVKRRFRGYFIWPLKFLIKRRDTREPSVYVEKSVVRPTFSSLGRFFIAERVLVALASRAAREVDGVHRVLRTEVHHRPSGLRLRVEMVLQYRWALREVLREAQRRVKQVVEYATGLDVEAVDVVAKRLILPEGYKAGKRGNSQ